MAKIKLGLDIGTNSIGWAVLQKEDKKYHFVSKVDETGLTIPSKGSYIFPKGVDGQEKSKAAVRRGFRSARRRTDRIRRRKVATLTVLSSFGLCPKLSEEELANWRYKEAYPCKNDEFIKWQRTGAKGGNIDLEKEKQPYYLRYLAATKPGMMNSKQGRYQLGRAFYHIAQRRGYLSQEEEQAEDGIEQFKNATINLLEEHSTVISFAEPFEVVADMYKNDKKAKALSTKIKRQIKKEASFVVIKDFIEKEFTKSEYLGKVATGINELTQRISENRQPTLGCYLYSIYAKKNGDGAVNRIRGRFTDREKHYLEEFNFICDCQNIDSDLREKLRFAIFYQRPLKSQKGLVAKCPFESKRKRIAVSHPLYEEFRKWESINRIKIKTVVDDKLRSLTKEEKELISEQFDHVKNVEFERIAKVLSGDKDYRYINEREKLNADIEFNFPMSTTFPGCPTIKHLKTILGKDENGLLRYNAMAKLNSGYSNEKAKERISIEDIWHCLFADSFGNKFKPEGRIEFAKRHLPEIDAEAFAKIKLAKGYGNLSKAAIKKIQPYLERGMLYSHAVFLANFSKVFGRKIQNTETEKIADCIKLALARHEFEKKVNAVVNNYIERCKSEEEGGSLGDEPTSQWVHQRAIKSEISSWFSESELETMSSDERDELEDNCWKKFVEQALNKHPKNIEYLSSKRIADFIAEEITRIFPNEKIDISQLYHPSAMEVYPKADTRLGSPEISSIKNPVFNKAMHQIMELVNKLIEEGMVDKDTEVNIEMAREINSASYRRALTQYQKDQKTIRDWARRKIIECYDSSIRERIVPTDTQITKYILYSEQKGQCLYTGEIITPRTFFSEQKYDIEHTIPRSKWNDNSLVNKTLANARFNREFKQAELPAKLDLSFDGKQIDIEFIIQNRDRWLRSYEISNDEVHFTVSLAALKAEYRKYKMAAKASAGDAATHEELMYRAHYVRLRLEYLDQKYKTFERDEVPAKFNNANLVDTRLITKYARAYLSSYFKKVNVINGQVTDTLRKIWGLQGEYEEKDRSNHIHHCIDAVTVACVEKGTAARLSESFHKYERDYVMGDLSAKVYLPEPMLNFVDTMKKLKDEVFIFHKQIDRIKPLLDEVAKENPRKLNLRGALNSQRPYGIRKKDEGETYFVQRTPITKLLSKDLDRIEDERIKERIGALCETRGKTIEKIVKEDGGVLVLPPFEAANNKGKLVRSGPMTIKKIRLRSSKTKLSSYKSVREIDRSKKAGQELKHEFYFDKEAGSNYEARVFGDFIPDPKGKMNREYRLINNRNIVKVEFQDEPSLQSLYSIHSDDMFLVFDKHYDEINWESLNDLQIRLFRNVKFSETEVIVFARHNYALGDVDHALSTNEDQLKDEKGVVLRRRPSTFRGIPTKIDALGRIDIAYSKAFIEKHTR